jgi:hypothetical protein
MCAQVLRKVAAESPQALVPHYGAIIPALVGLLQQTQGPTKLSGDRTLGKLLQVRLAVLTFLGCFTIFV